ncbi:MAG TPA: ASKHA domain-containing protein [Anaerolineae bacterium]|nr:ASKHA domain-containing protein [Anaerolineae bacterium]
MSNLLIAEGDRSVGETQQFRVIFQPAGRQGLVAAGTSLLDAARELGVEIESICGGRQTCAKCQVRVEEGVFARHGIESSNHHITGEGEREAAYRADKGLLPGCRMSCDARVQGDVLVTVPEESRAHKQVVRKAASVRAIELDPAVRLCYVELPPASMEDERSDWARLADELAARFALPRPSLRIDSAILPSLQPALRQGRSRLRGGQIVHGVTATLWRDREVLRVQPGYHERAYGVAVDVGTTTIAAHLAELRTGQVLATESCMNPQISYGEDLLSRVSYVMEHPDGLATLHRAVIEALNGLIEDATAAAGLSSDDVSDLVVVGNTIMHHILLGIDPRELGGAPFAPAIKEAVEIKARDLGLRTGRGATVYVPPVEAGYVGADNVAAIIAEEPHKRDEITLLIDVGTNGEIVLGNRQRLFSASSPTGPAFEGAQVRHGMRAAPGAIERARIDPATLAVQYRVIGREGWVESEVAGGKLQVAGDGEGPLSAKEAREVRQRRRLEEQTLVKAAGICGSGIIEAIAELYKAGVLDGSGRFVADAPTPRLGWDGAKGYFVLAWPHETSTGREIVVHADDIRAIQLAKAALYAGAKLLMRHAAAAGLTQVDRIVLAGAFGSYIDPEHAMILGLIPDCDLAHVVAVGNAAGDGALLMLLNRSKRLEAEAVAGQVLHIQTATDPHFQDEFVGAIAIPHASDPFPHLAPILAAAEAMRIIRPAAAVNGNGSDGAQRAQRRSERQERRGQRT